MTVEILSISDKSQKVGIRFELDEESQKYVELQEYNADTNAYALDVDPDNEDALNKIVLPNVTIKNRYVTQVKVADAKVTSDNGKDNSSSFNGVANGKSLGNLKLTDVKLGNGDIVVTLSVKPEEITRSIWADTDGSRTETADVKFDGTGKINANTTLLNSTIAGNGSHWEVSYGESSVVKTPTGNAGLQIVAADGFTIDLGELLADDEIHLNVVRKGLVKLGTSDTGATVDIKYNGRPVDGTKGVYVPYNSALTFQGDSDGKYIWKTSDGFTATGENGASMVPSNESGSFDVPASTDNDLYLYRVVGITYSSNVPADVKVGSESPVTTEFGSGSYILFGDDVFVVAQNMKNIESCTNTGKDVPTKVGETEYQLKAVSDDLALTIKTSV